MSSMKVQDKFTEKVQNKFRFIIFPEVHREGLGSMSSMKVQNNFTEKVQDKFRFIIFPEVHREGLGS